jgi:uncharacterized SAM-binding protein YcdF (DUF218 family)
MTYGRCRYAAWLHHNWRRLPIVVSGGSRYVNLTYASAMAQLLAAEDVPVESIWQEKMSQNTYENAKFTAELLGKRQIRTVVLVVEADSMLRAEKCFRKQGIHVVPAPFAHRVPSLKIGELIPSWTAVRRNERTLHELGGLVWYKLRGWI